MKLSDLPDINFIDVDAAAVEAAVFNSYKNITNRTPAKGDPVRLFLLFVSDVIVQLKNEQNYTGKQNLLKYSTGDNLDQLGALVDTERLSASAAGTTIKATLSAVREQSVIIPAGTRVTPDGKIYFALDAPLIIPAGTLIGEGHATCTVTGTSGNDFLPGEINTIVDPVAYVVSMVNTTKSEGGSDIESDDAYRERIHEAPEQFSVAGPDGAYEFYAKKASALIEDVLVMSPQPGYVNIYALLTGGKIPGEELLNDILSVCNDKKVRPLTDKVAVLAPDIINYSVDVTYYILTDKMAQLANIQAAVNDAVADWILWTKSKIGRDLNPSELNKRLVSAGAKRVEIVSPIFTHIQNGTHLKDGTVESVQLAVALEDISINYGGAEDE